MKNFILLLAMSFAWFVPDAIAVCSSPITRTNNTTSQVLTSTKYNTDLNTVYAKVNNLPGDCIVDESITTGKIADGAVTSAKLAADVLAVFIPVGAILPYAGTTAPDGFLLCNGQTVSRTTYADLYAVIANTYGSGNGSSTFHVPDLRGRFLRGVDGGVGRDPDRASRTAMNSGGAVGDNVGSVQTDEYASHTHRAQGGAGSVIALNAGAIGLIGSTQSSSYISTQYLENSGGNETRPENANVQYIIKY